MRQILLDLPTFGFIVSTRAALGVGLGLLLADKLPAHRRRRAAAALIGIGATATIPALMAVMRGRRDAREPASTIRSDPRLVGATRFARKGDDWY